MFKWVLGFFATLAGTVVCLMAMGVGTRALSYLLVAILLMIGTAFLIARPFLRSRTPPRS